MANKLYDSKALGGLEAGFGAPERGFQGPNAEAQKLKRDLKSFQDMQKWRSQGKHKLTGMQQDRIKKEAGELGERFSGLMGREAADIGKLPEATQPQPAPMMELEEEPDVARKLTGFLKPGSSITPGLGLGERPLSTKLQRLLKY